MYLSHELLQFSLVGKLFHSLNMPSEESAFAPRRRRFAEQTMEKPRFRLYSVDGATDAVKRTALRAHRTAPPTPSITGNDAPASGPSTNVPRNPLPMTRYGVPSGASTKTPRDPSAMRRYGVPSGPTMNLPPMLSLISWACAASANSPDSPAIINARGLLYTIDLFPTPPRRTA